MDAGLSAFERGAAAPLSSSFARASEMVGLWESKAISIFNESPEKPSQAR